VRGGCREAYPRQHNNTFALRCREALICASNSAAHAPLSGLVEWLIRRSIAKAPTFPPKSALIASISLSILSHPAASFLFKLELRGFHSQFPLCHPEMSVYLKPLAIPSRNSSMSDASPYTQSGSTSPADAWSSPATHSRRSSEGTHFLGIPGPSTPHIKDADSVDKEANAAAATASSSPSSEKSELT
jgi:hypothetical protein